MITAEMLRDQLLVQESGTEAASAGIIASYLVALSKGGDDALMRKSVQDMQQDSPDVLRWIIYFFAQLQAANEKEEAT